MIYRYKWERNVWFLVGAAVILLFVYLLIQLASVVYVHGSVNEDKLGPTMGEYVQKRAAEWNINKLINETLETAERFEPQK